MFSPRTLVFVVISALFVIAAAAKSNGSKGGGSRTDAYVNGWLGARMYDNIALNFPKTPMSMEQFGINSVAAMWQNRPERAQAAVCINSPWNTKNYDGVSRVMTLAYFKHTFWKKKIYMWDCLYIWGPDQQFYSFDDVGTDRMAWALDEKKCSMDNTTMDISCL